jgi:hypothetical protein
MNAQVTQPKAPIRTFFFYGYCILDFDFVCLDGVFLDRDSVIYGKINSAMIKKAKLVALKRLIKTEGQPLISTEKKILVIKTKYKYEYENFDTYDKKKRRIFKFKDADSIRLIPLNRYNIKVQKLSKT